MFPDGKSFTVWYYSWSGGSIFEPRFCKKHDFHKFAVFIKRHILQSKNFFFSRGLYLTQHLYGKPRFHRCSLMVTVLCVWYYSWSGGSIFEPRFCRKHNFYKFSVFIKRHFLRSKKSLPLERVIPYQTLVWWSLVSIDVPWWWKFYVYGTILGQEGASKNPGFAKKHDFHKFSVL